MQSSKIVKHAFGCIFLSNCHTDIGNGQVGQPKFVFEAKSIQRMELMVLSKLRWKMHAFTPCSFIEYFLHKMNEEQHLSESSISRSIQLILGTIRGTPFSLILRVWTLGISLFSRK